MESIYVSQKDMLEICQDGDKYFLRYPTFNITMPEVVREIPKEAADSYMSGEHTGKELMNYADYGFWKSKKQYTQEESNKIFIQNNPDLIFNDLSDNQKIFSPEEFTQIVTKAIVSEQYVARYGDQFDKKVIYITFQYSPSDNGLAFLAAVQKVLQPTDMSLKVELPE